MSEKHRCTDRDAAYLRQSDGKGELLVRTTAMGLPEDRIGEVLKIAGLPDTGKKRAGQFSLGMKQRLGIASALISHPDFLVLDVKCSPSQTVYAGV